MTPQGGDAGGTDFSTMGVYLRDYSFAVTATNTGHYGNSANASFALNNPASQIDFGYRAVHLTTVYAKRVIETYYGKAPEHSYFLGCSSGGKQGLKEVCVAPVLILRLLTSLADRLSRTVRYARTLALSYETTTGCLPALRLNGGLT